VARAFTLAALRGTRDANFGIQVVGRIMRVHPLLQHRPDTPQILNYGYVFRAKREAQEGLTGAATVINKLQEHTANTTPESVVTFTVDSSFVQIVKTGQTAAIFPPPDQTPATAVSTTDGTGPVTLTGAEGQSAAPLLQHTQPLFPELTKTALTPGAHDDPTASVTAFKLDAEEHYDYPLKVQDLPPFVTEVLPTNPDDFEVQLVSFVVFSGVLADRERIRSLRT
jgi:hypothetical protein